MAILEQCGGEIKDGLCRKCFNRSSYTSARCAQMYEVETKKPESVPSCGDGWISVNDRLPDEEHDYIVFVDGEQPFVAHFFLYPVDGSNWICYGHAVFPTHWQPLPKAPTKH